MKWKKHQPKCKTIEDVMEYNTGTSIDELLNPKEYPYLEGLKRCVDITKKCIAAKMSVTVVGDYDCDGDTATAILKLGLEEYSGKLVNIRLPRRFSEGYGLSTKIIDEIDSGLVITVDNGIAAVEAVKKAKDKGLTVIIIDHHMIRDDGLIPEADAIVDPHAIPGSEYDGYCGAGLAYRFVLELNPDTRLKSKLVALAGIGTVADVMPLIGDNRRIVKNSLESVSSGNITASLESLLRAIGLSDHPTEDNYAYKVGPCFNAAGRLEDRGAEKVVNFIAYDHEEYEAFLYQNDIDSSARELVEMNKKRQILVQEAMSDIRDKLNSLSKVKKPIVYVDTSLHEGLVGIFAGKIAEEYHCPALVFTESGKKGILKGSGRSYGDINLKEELDKCSDLFVGYGGHAGAAGMSIKKADVKKLEKRLIDNLSGTCISKPSDMYYDLECNVNDIPEICDQLRKYAPFGEKCPKIRYLIHDFCAVPKGSSYYEVMGQFHNHVKLYGKNFNVMGFEMADRFKDDGKPRKMDIIGTLNTEWFNGEKVYTVEMIDYQKQETKKTAAFNALQNACMFL